MGDGAGDDFAVQRDGGDDFDGKAVARAQFAEQSYVAGLLVAEVKIFAYQDGAHVQAADQNLLDELFGGEAREIECEGKNDGGLQAYGAEPVHALRIGGEAERSGFRAQDSARGGIEGQGGGDVASFRGVLDGGADDGLMAEVDAVEIADGEDAAAAGGGVMSGPLFGGGEGSDGALPGFGWGGDGTAGKRRGGVDAHIELQAVVGHLNMTQAELAQAVVGFRVGQIVGDVGEPGAARL